MDTRKNHTEPTAPHTERTNNTSVRAAALRTLHRDSLLTFPAPLDPAFIQRHDVHTEKTSKNKTMSILMLLYSKFLMRASQRLFCVRVFESWLHV